jgi:hypothetical protein
MPEILDCFGRDAKLAGHSWTSRIPDRKRTGRAEVK